MSMAADIPVPIDRAERAARVQRQRFDAEWIETQNEPGAMSEALKALRTKALDDLKSRREGAVTEWIFLHAAAKGDEAIAHRQLKALEQQEELVHVRMLSMETEAAQQVYMARVLGPLSFARVEQRLADAVARTVATERVIGLLQARDKAPRPAAPPPQAMSKRP
jgi:hypothetical protein